MARRFLILGRGSLLPRIDRRVRFLAKKDEQDWEREEASDR